jgi:hypothetical protein
VPPLSPLVFQVLAPGDLNEVYDFAEARLREEISDENERIFRSWDVRWKKEALDHYLKLGWSFIARRDGRAVGFFLGQPFLFFRGHTQTLWVEHIEANDKEVSEALCDVAVKVAREKHLQRVLFSTTNLSQELKKWSPVALPDSIAEIKTTK